MSREDPQLRIRLPIETKKAIEDSAKKHSRSLNAEIVEAVSYWLSAHKSPVGKPTSTIEVIWQPTKAEFEEVIQETQRTTLTEFMAMLEQAKASK